MSESPAGQRPQRHGAGRGDRLRRLWTAPSQKAAAALACTAGIILEPHNPIQVPGHRAVMWLTLLVAARLFCGRGWSTAVGIASATGALVLLQSSHGVWTVVQYAIAGVLVDAVLSLWPKVGVRPMRLMATGALIELSVGWIAPLGQSVFSGIGATEIWQSLETVGWPALGRLFALDLCFGAIGGLVGWALVSAVVGTRPTRGAVRTSGMISAAT
ncbi:MAG TPA: hypothetical protein VHT30_10550 [Acidimicrobiales bacterium]|jgi:hypothetical protein|nr:hypothetical protein [Acidimicrobiales bacterium]